jgi:hypothetical protein
MSDPEEQGKGSVGVLGESLSEAFDPDQYGFPWYRSFEDPEIRAVRSNQAIGLVDAAAAHLDALLDSASQVRELVGPNGRLGMQSLGLRVEPRGGALGHRPR